MIKLLKKIYNSLFVKPKKIEYIVFKTRAQLISEGRGTSVVRKNIRINSSNLYR